MPIHAQLIALDPQSDRTKQQQIQQSVSESILAGRFLANEKLPSSRALAEHLGVARITVTLAYTELVANDYLTAHGRSGYFVSENAPRRPTFTSLPSSRDDAIDWSTKLVGDVETSAHLARPGNWRDYRYPFIYGQSDPRLFDHRSWRQCALEALGRKDFESMTVDYYQRDDPKLIDYILKHIVVQRGITARPEEVLLTMGAQNALWIAAQLLLGEGQTAAIENPHYPEIRDILTQARCDVHYIDVDEKGLPPDSIPDGVHAVFTTASHHCPTNVTMPVARRRALIERATKDGFIIVEDDYESEISFGRAPSPALKSLDEIGCVVHVGSFSKSIFPGLRLGYLVAPERFIEAARKLRTLVLRHPPGHTQRSVAYFLALGHHAAQTRRMDQTYRRRREVMKNAIDAHRLTVVNREISGGSSFWMRAPEGIDTSALALKLRQSSVLIEPGSAFFCPDKPETSFYRLAYSSIEEAKIPDGIAMIAEALSNHWS